jgi:hypothetical protein
MLPRDVLPGQVIPVLGTGKTDYVALATLVESTPFVTAA